MMSRAPGPVLAIESEILEERAHTLARLGRQLEAALADLAARGAGPSPAPPEARRILLDSAAMALWEFVVHREACGLRDSQALMREYGVPNEVRLRMGAFPARNHSL